MFNRIRTTLLAQEKEHIYQKFQPIRDAWKKKGVSIVSDGWSDRQRRPMINLMAASSGGAMFLKAVDASGITKDGEYVGSLFQEAIKEVGESNVVQIITDNARNYKSAGNMIESRYAHVFWTPCVVHSLNLALKSICEPPEKSPQYAECKWISDLISDVHSIRNFIVNHGMALAIFNSYSHLSLLRVAETRFASSIVMTKRLKEVKGALEKMVIDADWKVYREGSNEAKAQQVKHCIVEDTWWDKVDYFLKFTEPMVDMLRKADTDMPVLHLIYDMWDSMIENVKKIIFLHEGKDLITGSSTFFDAVQLVLETRWNKSNTPLHCMAHSLVPKYYHESWLQNGSNGDRRLAPHEDAEVSANRGNCFLKLFPESNDLRKVYREFGAFSTGSGYFNEPHVIDARIHEEPMSWWVNHGASLPLLQGLAFKLLMQPASSSCCERNWSTYSFIQNIKRNNLTPTRAEDLVFVHYNLQLLSQNEKDYKEGDTKYWTWVCMF